MKVKIYKRVERFGLPSFVSRTRWFTTREAAFNYGHTDALAPPQEVEVTLTVAGLVRFLNREL